MNTKLFMVILTAMVLSNSPAFAAPLGTAFTYQGKLADAGQPAHGAYDFRFAIYDAASGGGLVAGPLTNSPVAVSNGLFTVTLDFGSGVFTGDARWLEIGVRTHGGGDFLPLAPRQALTPVPCALFAPTAGDLRTGASPTFTGAVLFDPAAGPPFAVGNTNKVANLHADFLDGLNAAAFWQRGGNVGTTAGPDFVGTADLQPLELKVNGKRALRLEPFADAPNVIAGAVNYAADGAVGVTIGGGGNVNGTNRVSGWFGTVGGGRDNQIGSGASGAVVSGGAGNTVQGNAGYAAIAGGQGNTVGQNAHFASVGGGLHNVVSAGSENATIGGGEGNRIAEDADGACIGGGRQNVLHASLHSTIAGGEQNSVTNTGHATIAGGLRNRIGSEAHDSAIGGGVDNQIQEPAWSASIAGGAGNLVSNAKYGVISGGNRNALNTGADWSAISGGANNVISNADFSAISGGQNNVIQEDAAWANIGGGRDNVLRPGTWHARIGGGRNNLIENDAAEAIIGGGKDNLIQTNADGAIIAGGYGNAIGPEAPSAVVNGGWDNKIQSLTDQGAIGGGFRNTITTNADRATIAGGSGNTIGQNAYSAAVVGGEGNVIGADAAFATILGGDHNLAAGPWSLAAGRAAHADHRGAFVWADSENNVFPSTRDDEFAVRAAGGLWLASRRGVRLTPGNYGPLITATWDPFPNSAPVWLQGVGRWGLFMEGWDTLVAGIPEDSAHGPSWFQVAKYATNGTRTALMTVDLAGNVAATSFNPTSDREAKENFAPVDGREVLEKVAALPITRWNFKGDAATQHVGPTAQDFHAAFSLGTDDKHIATVDADGVALAAIQGLNQKLTEELKRRDAENAALRCELTELKQLVRQLLK
ncbi:MAG: tail fiber domain-containing protein [Verrucomicrobia bacterium]|nr:tail fiber domain-containing protein [Verrucomicrobiota bacterium]